MLLLVFWHSKIGIVELWCSLMDAGVAYPIVEVVVTQSFAGRSESKATRFVFTRFSFKGAQSVCQKKVYSMSIP